MQTVVQWADNPNARSSNRILTTCHTKYGFVTQTVQLTTTPKVGEWWIVAVEYELHHGSRRGAFFLIPLQRVTSHLCKVEACADCEHGTGHPRLRPLNRRNSTVHRKGGVAIVVPTEPYDGEYGSPVPYIPLEYATHLTASLGVYAQLPALSPGPFAWAGSTPDTPVDRPEIRYIPKSLRADWITEGRYSGTFATHITLDNSVTHTTDINTLVRIIAAKSRCSVVCVTIPGEAPSGLQALLSDLGRRFTDVIVRTGATNAVQCSATWKTGILGRGDVLEDICESDEVIVPADHPRLDAVAAHTGRRCALYLTPSADDAGARPRCIARVEGDPRWSLTGSLI